MYKYTVLTEAKPLCKGSLFKDFPHSVIKPFPRISLEESP